MDVGMYDAMFTIGLRLPLTDLHRQLANYLGLSISQIAPNSWRIFIGAKVIWGQLSGGNLHSMSSSIVTNPSTSPRLNGFTIF